MALKVLMDNGREHIVQESFCEFKNIVTNSIGVMINGLVEIDSGVYINPSHISEIEIVDEQ